MLARLAGTWSLVAVAGVLGCGSNQNQVAEAPACEAAEGNLPMDATAQAWAGQYRLVMVATAGDSAGRSVTGGMQLMVQSEELQIPPMGSADDGTRMLLYGSTNIDLPGILAVEVGALDSDDPLAPGVLVIERPVELDGGSSMEITIRLGSEANRRGVTRFGVHRLVRPSGQHRWVCRQLGQRRHGAVVQRPFLRQQDRSLDGPSGNDNGRNDRAERRKTSTRSAQTVSGN